MHRCDTRYSTTSADPDHIRADTLLARVRHPWQIENSVCFVKDRWWDEDRHWTKRPGLTEWRARLTTLATMVLRIFCRPGQPVRADADDIQRTPRLVREILPVA